MYTNMNKSKITRACLMCMLKYYFHYNICFWEKANADLNVATEIISLVNLINDGMYTQTFSSG